MIKKWFFLFSLTHSLLCFGKMSLEDRVGQVFIAPVYERELTDHGREYLKRSHLGNVIYFGFANGPIDREQITKLSQDLKETMMTPPLIAVDQEGVGFNQLKEGFTFFSNRNDPYTMGRIIGEELSQAGITTDFAPVVDTVLRPDCPIHYRSFGSDPDQVIASARQVIGGLHQNGIHAVLKHFPGLGDTDVDSHLALPVLNKTLEEIDDLELKPYYALKEEADAIMVAHLLVPKIDPHRPATLSPIFVTEILREKIGFDKVIISDSLVMRGVLGKVSSFEEAVEKVTKIAIDAFLAGSDLLILAKLQWADFEPTTQQDEELIVRVISGFVDAVRKGEISEERLDRSVKRIQEMKMSYYLK